MRKVFIFIAICILSIFLNPVLTVSAKNEFARAENPINLYRLTTTSNNFEDVICIIEKSYFVEILSENVDSYKVNYNGITGFVKKNDVKIINEIPSTPYPYNIKITLGSNCNLRSSPTTKSIHNNILTSLNSGENNINFIGRIYSDEAIDFGGTTWYYVEYNGTYGYIYNKYIKSISTIYENTENYTYKDDLLTSIKNPLENIPSIILIIILSIPYIFVILILYLPNKFNKKKVKKLQKEQIDNF